MVTKSSIEAKSTKYYFTLSKATLNLVIPEDVSFISENGDFTVEVENEVGFVQKKLTVTGLFTSDQGGDSAAVKFINFLNFVQNNVDEQMTLTLQLDGGNYVKTYTGKIIGGVAGSILDSNPNDIQFSFTFIIVTAGW